MITHSLFYIMANGGLLVRGEERKRGRLGRSEVSGLEGLEGFGERVGLE